MKKTFYIILTVLLLAIFSAATYAYLQRDSIIASVLSEKLSEVEVKRNVKISYESLNMQGLNGICLSDIAVVPTGCDTLSTIGSVCAEISLWELIKGRIKVSKLHIDSLSVRLTDNGKQRNFDPLFKKGENKSVQSKDDTQKKSYSERFSNMLSTIFRLVPEDFAATNIRMSAQSPTYNATLMTPELKVDNNKFTTDLIFSEDSTLQEFTLDGTFRHTDKSLHCKIFAPKNNKVALPYIKYKYDMTVAFDTAQLDFNALADKTEWTQIGGNLAVKNLCVEHWRISEKELLFEDMSIDYILNARNDCIELDSSSVVHFNKLTFSPYIRVKTKPETELTVSVCKDKFPADDLFSSIPSGMFSNLEGIKTSGSLDYKFYLNINFDNVDSLKLYSCLNKHDFKIEQFGATDFRMMQQPFTYNAYEKGELARSFVVGEENPNFRKLDDISPCLRGAVMFSEDGHFFHHKGFLESAIRESMIRNIKEKRFARGGSTISMQLVKNVFLSRNKTMMRKLEEMMIVWLIENNRLVTKERMYETYLNIIEWGPNIYGAEEAAKFYFDKSCDDLSPAEAIFMASIIPRPKKFKWSFNEDGTLKEYHTNYYEVVGGRLHKHGYISDREFRKLKPEVELKGKAKDYFPDLSEKEEKPSVFKNFFNIFKRKK